ncbi:MAG TPA: hypothetical protein VLK36_06410 [Gaiellaceae bacterium]|nr:hypothetical protein [Gaiellaceae bacterium]
MQLVRMRRRHQHDNLFFLFSLVFFPLALIVAYVVSDRTASRPAY